MTAPADCACPPGAHGPVAGCAAHALPCPVCTGRSLVSECGVCGRGTQREADDLRARLAAVTRERDEARAMLATCDRERVHYRARAAEHHRRAQWAEACVERAMHAGLSACERLRAELAFERGAVDHIIEQRDESDALLADALRCGLDEAERLRVERDAERLRAARLRAALAWAATRCEQGYDAAYVGRELRATLAADDAARAGGTTGEAR